MPENNTDIQREQTTSAALTSRNIKPVTVIGAGLAGSEAAWQLASAGIPVTLIEMRPDKNRQLFQQDILLSLSAPIHCDRIL